MNLRTAAEALPEPVFNALRFGNQSLKLLRTYALSLSWTLYDCLRYLRHQGEHPGSYSRDQHLAHIAKTYHSLEKGLSLHEPRPGFGIPNAQHLIDLIEIFVRSFGTDPVVDTAMGTLADYLHFQEGAGFSLPILRSRHEAAKHLILRQQDGCGASGQSGGVVQTTRDQLSTIPPDSFLAFLKARHSIRDFQDKAVDADLLLRAAEMAQQSPSACNRQAGRAHCFTAPDQVRRVLSLQPGNRGFGDRAAAAVVITADVDAYSGAGERHQSVVDGALFAMTFVYGLHSLGLGSCMLAWAVSPSTDKALRKTANIPDNEEIIVLLAVGHIPEELRVPASIRIAPDTFTKLNAAAGA